MFHLYEHLLNTSRVPAVLLRGNSIDASFFGNLYCESFDTYHWISQEEIPKPNILTGTRTKNSFRVCDLSAWNRLSETNKFCLGAILSFLFPSYRKHPRQDSNTGQFFGDVAFVPVISSPKQTTLDLVPFFCGA
jgi:hypothetical protein